MSIISFEDIENQLVKEEDPVSNIDLLEENYNKTEELIDSVFSLEELIETNEEILKDAKNDLKSLEDLKQHIQDTMVTSNHILNVLGKSSLKQVANLKNQNITFEAIDNNPIGTLESFNNMLKDVRVSISEEDWKDVIRSLGESFTRIFTSYKKDYKDYSRRSKEVIKVLFKYKRHLQLDGEITLGAKETIYSSSTIIDIANNFANFVDSYASALSNGKSTIVTFDLKKLKEFKNIQAKEPDRYALGVDTSGYEGITVKTLSGNDLNVIREAFDVSTELRRQKVDFVNVPITSNTLTINTVDKLLERIKILDKIMDDHYSIVEKPLNTHLVKGKKFASITRDLLAFAASWVISGWASKLAVKALKVTGKKMRFATFMGAGIAADLIFDRLLNCIPVNKINKNLYALAKNNYAWKEINSIQKDLISHLVINNEQIKHEFDNDMKEAFRS